MSGKKNSAKARSVPTVASPHVPHVGQLFKFPKPKKRRGRPRKAAATPAADDFDIVCAAIRGIPKGRRLAKAKAEARRIVGADKRSTRTELALYERVLDVINHAQGKDWHSVSFYAKDDQCGPPKRTVERSFKGLVRNGHLIRRRIPGAKGGWDISETTSPTLARAGNIVALAPIDVDTDENIAATADEKCTGCRPINTWGTDLECTGYRPRNTGGTDVDVGLISKVNLQENLKVESARASPREGDIQNSILAEGAKPAALAHWEAVARHRDTSLPLAERITIDGADCEFLERLGKGWPLATLRDQFCAWNAARGQTLRDAQAAFAAWLISTHDKRIAGTPEAIATLQGNPEAQITAIRTQARKERWEPERAARELADVWAREDKADAPLRAPFAPIEHRLRSLRLAQCNALILRKLRGAS